MKEKPNWDGETPVWSPPLDNYVTYDEICQHYQERMGSEDSELEPDEDYLTSLELRLLEPVEVPLIKAPDLNHNVPYWDRDWLDEIVEEANNKIKEKFEGMFVASTTRAIYGTGDEGEES